jgi:hypothetical protein
VVPISGISVTLTCNRYLGHLPHTHTLSLTHTHTHTHTTQSFEQSIKSRWWWGEGSAQGSCEVRTFLRRPSSRYIWLFLLESLYSSAIPNSCINIVSADAQKFQYIYASYCNRLVCDVCYVVQKSPVVVYPRSDLDPDKAKEIFAQELAIYMDFQEKQKKKKEAAAATAALAQAQNKE